MSDRLVEAVEQIAAALRSMAGFNAEVPSEGEQVARALVEAAEDHLGHGLLAVSAAIENAAVGPIDDLALREAIERGLIAIAEALERAGGRIAAAIRKEGEGL